MEKTKTQLLQELAQLETLEKKLKTKKSKVQYKGVDIPFIVGEKYFIRTVSYHLTGQVKAIVGDFLVLENAAWVADSGRFNEAIKTGVLAEVEPVFVDTFVNTKAITDAFVWEHSLPREVK